MRAATSVRNVEVEMTTYLLTMSQLQKDSSENSKEKKNLLNWERKRGSPGMFDLDGLKMGYRERFRSEQSGRREDKIFPRFTVYEEGGGLVVRSSGEGCIWSEISNCRRHNKLEIFIYCKYQGKPNCFE